MAGAGYKLFNTGDVLTAAQVNTYLQEQTVMVFANSTARTTALSGVLAEGMVSYLQDTNAVEVYNGSAWVGVSGAGDVTEVQAGTGISVASGTGPIPVVTNTMATAVDAKGDLIVGTGADTFARLAVGTNGYTLVADSSTATGLAYAAPASGGMTLLSTTTLSGATVTISGISQSYKNLYLVIDGVTNATANGFFKMRVNNEDLCSTLLLISDGGAVTNRTDRQDSYRLTASAARASTFTDANNAWAVTIDNYTSTTNRKPITHYGIYNDASTLEGSINGVGGYDANTAITSLVFSNSGGNLSTGTVKLYGVN